MAFATFARGEKHIFPTLTLVNPVVIFPQLITECGCCNATSGASSAGRCMSPLYVCVSLDASVCVCACVFVRTCLQAVSVYMCTLEEAGPPGI